jgi:drug/metabolite transporter (DMT)-like permease
MNRAAAARPAVDPPSARPTDRRSRLDTTAVLCLLLCCVLWGVNQVTAKVALTEFPPLWQAASRSAVAALCLVGWMRWRGVPLRPPAATWGAGLLVGALFAAEFACIFVGLQYTGASRMVVFIYLAPFVVALGMPFVARGERLAGWQWTGLVLAFAGVGWAFSEGFRAPANGPRQWWGDALGVVGALLWGATTLAVRASRLSQAPAEQTLLYQLAVSGVLLAALAFAVGEPWPQRLGPAAASAFAFQAVVVTFASYLLWFWLVRHYPATLLSAFTLLTPVSGLASGVLLLDEPLTTRLLAAMAAVAVGIAVVSLAGRRR